MRRRMAAGVYGIAAVLGISQAVVPLAFAQEERVLEGEVIDPSTYLKSGHHGPAMAQDTYDAVDGGQSLALLVERTGTLYLLLTATPGEDPSEPFYNYVNQMVKVRGMVYERDGVQGIVPIAVHPRGSARAPDASLNE